MIQEIVTRQRISAGLLLAILLPAAGGLIAWGSNLTRVQEIERHVEFQDSQIREDRATLTQTQRALAIEDTQYSEILRRLDQIDHKLEVR